MNQEKSKIVHFRPPSVQKSSFNIKCGSNILEVISQYNYLGLTLTEFLDLGDNCIQICHFGRYIVGYTVGNFVLRRRVSGAVKHDFRTYIRRYTSPNDKFEYGYPHSNVLLNMFTSKPGIFFKNISYMSDVYPLR